MNRMLLALIVGFSFGIIGAMIMIIEKYHDRWTVLITAFFTNFAIGFYTVASIFPSISWQRGLFAGLLLSLPLAVIMKKYSMILGIGALGGLVLGLMVGGLGI